MYIEHDIQTGKGEWIRTVNSHMTKLGISWDDLKIMNRKNLKNRIREWDTQKWMEEMLNTPTLQWYREGKSHIGYDNCYRNTRRSEYLAKAQTHSLQLEEPLGRRNQNYDKTCKLCHIEENLEHF